MSPADVNNKTFLFILSWVVTIFGLTIAAKTRLGYNIIYYALLLLILLIVVTEYQTLAPILGAVDTPLAFDQSVSSGFNG
jgi:hypothetical protein